LHSNIDVLLPFHRRDSYFQQALISLSRTKSVSIRLILIDDSLQQNIMISDLPCNFHDLELVKTGGNLGYGLALKKGSEFIGSESVGLFNSDDLVDPFRFKKQLETLDSHDLSVTGMYKINQKGAPIAPLTGEIKSKKYDPIYLLLGSYGANATWVMQKTWWLENAFFDSKEALDWRIALRAFPNSKIHWNPEKLYTYRKHPDQVTARKLQSEQCMDIVYEEWKSLCNKLGIHNSSRLVFNCVATPWLYTGHASSKDIIGWTKIFRDIIKDKDVYRDVTKLLDRRYLNHARYSTEGFSSRAYFVLKAIRQVPILTKELIFSSTSR
jgi:hypothetical protein